MQWFCSTPTPFLPSPKNIEFVGISNVTIIIRQFNSVLPMYLGGVSESLLNVGLILLLVSLFHGTVRLQTFGQCV
jgi:hypothetical protein